MNARRPIGLLSALLFLLLAGCGGPAAGSPSVSPDAAPSPSETAVPSPTSPPAPPVAVHWDALGERELPLSTAKRLSDGPLDDFAPGRYGAVTPYIGSEQAVAYDYGEEEPTHYETHYLYGLCTTGGTILTDPVFNHVYRLSCYDLLDDTSQALPVWAVTRTMYSPDDADDWDRGYYNAVGFLAADGSWYTGCRFRSGVSNTIVVGRDSVLVMEDQDNAVLISVSDGSELARYSPYDFIGPDDPNGVAEWLFSDGLNWGMLSCYGDYFYCDPIMSGGAFEGEPIWIDGATGEFLDEAPMEVPEYTYTGHYTFDGGWYDGDNGDQFAEGGDLVLHLDDGTEKTIHLTGEQGQLYSVSADHLLFWRSAEDGSAVYVLTDHDLNVLRTVRGGMDFYSDSVTNRRYPVCYEILDEDAWLCRYTILDSQGRDLVSSLSYFQANDGLVPVVDERTYRLVDLSGGSCREVFRLPRYAALDAAVDD